MMVFCPVTPGVVGNLVIIPDDDKRMVLVTGLKVGIAVILGIAQSVVFQRDQLIERRYDPTQFFGLAAGITVRGVFVEIVTKVYDRVDVAIGNFPIHIEESRRIVRA